MLKAMWYIYILDKQLYIACFIKLQKGGILYCNITSNHRINVLYNTLQISNVTFY